MAKLLAKVKTLGPQQYLLETWNHDGGTALLVVGGDPIGTLYGAYRLAEHLGARFYLHGDVLPDTKTPLEMPTRIIPWAACLTMCSSIRP